MPKFQNISTSEQTNREKAIITSVCVSYFSGQFLQSAQLYSGRILQFYLYSVVTVNQNQARHRNCNILSITP